MEKKTKQFLIALSGLIAVGLVFGSCLSTSVENEEPEDPSVVFTQVAKTVIAAFEQTRISEQPKEAEVAVLPTETIEPTPAMTNTPAPPSFGDGTWIIGSDIPAGTYRTSGTDSCYWERISGFGGTFSEIIANDNPDGQVVVTILPTDKGFTSKRCGTWVMIGN